MEQIFDIMEFPLQVFLSYNHICQFVVDGDLSGLLGIGSPSELAVVMVTAPRRGPGYLARSMASLHQGNSHMTSTQERGRKIGSLSDADYGVTHLDGYNLPLT